MSIEERKARLVSIILNTQEDELIEMLEEDVIQYQQQDTKDAADDLSPEELAELKELMEDENPDNYISLEDFRKEIAQWRSR